MVLRISLLTAVLFLLTAFSLDMPNATSAKTTKSHCKKIYKRVHGKKAIHRIYRGKRRVTRQDSGEVGRIIRCQAKHNDRKALKDYRKKRSKAWAFRRTLTGFVIRGYSSTFGPPLEGGQGAYGSLSQPCIATRHTGLRYRKFWLTVRGASAQVVMCDWGPASWTGRDIDITGSALYKLGISPHNYGNYYAKAELMR